ncbi:hypothetical protein SAMN04488244_12942 [Vibrio hangzhouensis]|uniref:Uncharacterized protein n=1 Tax=Vibrio hangzhouensis TaxID=462991 RepID=A0A1H6C275_9VIBR|nr:hypothetical protein [Vibrio hangzhouensis]SEG67059.1 hypothetical protein SAMN04488244_12942 [Vibrio hangzhouensis]
MSQPLSPTLSAEPSRAEPSRAYRRAANYIARSWGAGLRLRSDAC